MAVETLLHATSVVLAEAATPFGGPLDAAVVLLGRSGAGKSDVALRLMAQGARLLADDQTLLSTDGTSLFASAPLSLHRRMEIHGVGIVAFDAARSAPVILAVELDAGHKPARLPEQRRLRLPAAFGNLEGPHLVILHPFHASTPAKIAAAAAAIARGGFVAGLGASEPTPSF